MTAGREGPGAAGALLHEAWSTQRWASFGSAPTLIRYVRHGCALAKALTLTSHQPQGNLEQVRANTSGGFDLWVRPDCAESDQVSTNYRTWFYFSVEGGAPGESVTLRIVNMNDKSKLYSKGMRPVVRTTPHRPLWRRLDHDIKYDAFDYDRETHDINWAEWHRRQHHSRGCPCRGAGRKEGHPGRFSQQPPVSDTTTMATRGMVLTMQYTFESQGERAYFAFCLPFSYSELQHHLRELDRAMGFRCATCPARCIYEDAHEDGKYPEAPFGMPTLRDAFGDGKAGECKTEGKMGGTDSRSALDHDTKTSPASKRGHKRPYYHRQLLALTHEGRRVDLLTISSRRGITRLRSRTPVALETQLESCWCCAGMRAPEASAAGPPPAARLKAEEVGDIPRERRPLTPEYQGVGVARRCTAALSFGSKPIVFVSSRVHPGETPSSHILNGFLRLLLDPTSSTGRALLDNYVFKIVPMLNPDGVAHGHYRTDTLGQNLNRFYNQCGLACQPTIFAVRSLLALLGAPCDAPPPLAPQAATTLKGRPPRAPGRPAGGSKLRRALSPKASVRSRGIKSSSVPKRKKSAAGKVSGVRRVPSPIPRTSRQRAGAAQEKKRASRRTDLPACFSRWGPYGWCRDAGRAATRSRLWVYVDLHAHASKLGCFVYGNHFDAQNLRQATVRLFARLMEMNCRHFSYKNSNFTQRNMQSIDKQDGLSKQGSGRVGTYKLLPHLTHCYTLECNYHTGRGVRRLVQLPSAPKKKSRGGDSGKDDDGSSESSESEEEEDAFVQYIKADFEHMGEAICRTVADISGVNPDSRLAKTEHQSLGRLMEWVRTRKSGRRKRNRKKKKPA